MRTSSISYIIRSVEMKRHNACIMAGIGGYCSPEEKGEGDLKKPYPPPII